MKKIKYLYLLVGIIIGIVCTNCFHDYLSSKKQNAIIEASEENDVNEQNNKKMDKVEYSFRKINWGMSEDEVVASEEIVPMESNDMFIRYDLVNEWGKVILRYYLDHKKVYKATYNYEISSKDNADSILSAYKKKYNISKHNEYTEEGYGRNHFVDTWKLNDTTITFDYRYDENVEERYKHMVIVTYEANDWNKLEMSLDNDI